MQARRFSGRALRLRSIPAGATPHSSLRQCCGKEDVQEMQVAINTPTLKTPLPHAASGHLKRSRCAPSCCGPSSRRKRASGEPTATRAQRRIAQGLLTTAFRTTETAEARARTQTRRCEGGRVLQRGHRAAWRKACSRPGPPSAPPGPSRARWVGAVGHKCEVQAQESKARTPDRVFRKGGLRVSAASAKANHAPRVHRRQLDRQLAPRQAI